MSEPQSMKGTPRDMRPQRYVQEADDPTLRHFQDLLAKILGKSRQATSSEGIADIAAALAKAQADFKTPKKSKIGKIQGTTKDGRRYEYEYKYADLQDVYDCVRQALSDNDLAITHLTQEFAGQLELVTMLVHQSGQWFKSIYPVKAATDQPQKVGSAMTYARRYTVSALLGIASEEDDDAQSASESAPVEKPTPAKVSTLKPKQPAQAPAAPAGKLEVMLADGSLQEFKRTQAGAVAALSCIEQAVGERPDTWGPNAEVAWTIAKELPQLLIRDDITASMLVEDLERSSVGTIL